MKRRLLELRSFDELCGEVSTLRAGAYQRVGAWSLGQNCEHIAKMIDQSIDGFDARFPWIIRAGGPVVKWWLFRSRKMPAGVKGPPSFMPSGEVDDAAGAERLMRTVERYVSYGGALQPSPLLGRLSRQEWDQVHLIHASHHLSFIVPEASIPAANRAGG